MLPLSDTQRHICYYINSILVTCSCISTQDFFLKHKDFCLQACMTTCKVYDNFGIYACYLMCKAQLKGLSQIVAGARTASKNRYFDHFCRVRPAPI